MSVVDEYSLPSLNEPRTYISRRGKVYDDSDSDGDTDPNNPRFLDTGVIKYRDTLGKVHTINPNPRFIRYKNYFTNLMKQICVVTEYPIVSLIISNDSSLAITVQKVDELFSKVVMYRLDDYECCFEEDIKGDYIKVTRVE